MTEVRQFLEQFSEIRDDYWELFSSKLTKREFKKKEIILNKGEIENYLSFVSKGIIRHFIPNEDKDTTFDFFFANQFTSAYDSFLRQMPSNYSVQALTDVQFWSISFKDLQHLYGQTFKGNLFGRMAAENMYMLKAKREISLLNETAEQRYLNLFKEQPQLIKLIPLKYISSYIGITPQALSRIRKRIFLT